MSWLSLCSSRYRIQPRKPSQAVSLQNPTEVARGILSCFYTRDDDGVRRWREAGREAREVLLCRADDGTERPHSLAFVSAVAAFAAADFLDSRTSDVLDVLPRLSPMDELSSRALELLSGEVESDT